MQLYTLHTHSTESHALRLFQCRRQTAACVLKYRAAFDARQSHAIAAPSMVEALSIHIFEFGRDQLSIKKITQVTNFFKANQLQKYQLQFRTTSKSSQPTH